MIQRVHLANVRAFENVEFTLEPFTVLVGANGTGKSTILRALAAPNGIGANDVRFHQATMLSVTLDAEGATRTFELQRTANSVGAWKRHPAGFGVAPLRLDLAKLRQPNQVREEAMLITDGGNLTNVFSSLDRETQIAVGRELCRLVPAFTDVQARPHASAQAGHQTLLFRDAWAPQVWYPPSEVSDGTMLMLAFLVLQHLRQKVDLITIEEPERGLHPHLLGELAGLLRNIAHGKIGSRPIQIVAATHSAEILEYLEPQEVRFLTRAKDTGAVQVEGIPTNDPHWQRAFREYDESLGSIWLSGGLRSQSTPRS